MRIQQKLFLTSLALGLFIINANCQTMMTEGTIEYSVTNIFPNKKQPKDTFNIFTERFRFKDKKQRTDRFLNNILTDSRIYDGEKPNIILWIKKEKTVDESVLYKYGDFDSSHICNKEKFKFLNEQKTICSYICNKYEYTLPGDTTKYYVYCTKDVVAPLPSDLVQQFFYLDGFPMEYNFNQSGKQVIYKITKMSADKIEDNVFAIPKDYKTQYFDKKNK